MCAIELIDLKRIKDKNSKYLLTYFKHYYFNNTNHICHESQHLHKKHKLLSDLRQLDIINLFEKNVCVIFKDFDIFRPI